MQRLDVGQAGLLVLIARELIQPADGKPCFFSDLLVGLVGLCEQIAGVCSEVHAVSMHDHAAFASVFPLACK